MNTIIHQRILEYRSMLRYAKKKRDKKLIESITETMKNLNIEI